VLGDVASNHMLMAKYRKANLLESVVLGRPAVPAAQKAGVVDILAPPPAGVLAGELCMCMYICMCMCMYMYVYARW